MSYFSNYIFKQEYIYLLSCIVELQALKMLSVWIQTFTFTQRHLAVKVLIYI